MSTAISPRNRMIAGFVFANIAIIVTVALVIFGKPQSPPTIQGVVLPVAREIPPFVLVDHRNRIFTNEDLIGQWHLVSYGYTTCPDVCPTTLAQLADVERRLNEQGDSLPVLFYSIDHNRDTVAQLARYVPFFHPDFIGLTHFNSSKTQHLPFEQGLGITSQLTPVIEESGSASYTVAHGVTLFLINPQGQLQAILKPGRDMQRNQVFDAETIYEDFLQLRDFFG
ncbi:MAG: protein SCO1/2 [Halioglobus sp.]